MRGVLSGAVRVAAVTVLVAASACATRAPGLASRFVKAGEPIMSFDDPSQTARPAPELSDYMRKMRALQSRATPKSSFLPTIESTDPVLSRALLVLAIQESPANHRRVAAAYQRVGVLDYAYRHFQRAAVMSECDGAAFDGMARLWRDWGMPDLALSDASHALRCNPASAEVYNTIGTVLESLGRQAAAARAYEKAVALNPRAPYALNNLCYLELTKGDPVAATRFCEAALAVDADFAAARNNLALVEARGGNLAGAEKRLRAGSPSAASFYNVGVLRLSEGRYSEAALAFDQATVTQPGMTLARQRSVQARKAAHAEQPQ